MVLTKAILKIFLQKKSLAIFPIKRLLPTNRLIADDELIITADTIVILGQKVMGKPKDIAEAKEMLHELSGHTHQVITGVCLTTKKKQVCFSVETDVTFKEPHKRGDRVLCQSLQTYG